MYHTRQSLTQAIMRRSELGSKYLKNSVIVSKAKYKKKSNFCDKVYKKERKKSYSTLELNQIPLPIRPLLGDECIQSSAITLINNENVISDDFKLAQMFNN